MTEHPAVLEAKLAELTGHVRIMGTLLEHSADRPTVVFGVDVAHAPEVGRRDQLDAAEGQLRLALHLARDLVQRAEQVRVHLLDDDVEFGALLLRLLVDEAVLVLVDRPRLGEPASAAARAKPSARCIWSSSLTLSRPPASNRAQSLAIRATLEPPCHEPSPPARS